MWHGSGVDIDAYSALREPRWRRLQQLSRTRRRTGAEADEMTRLYRSTAADLAAVRSAAPEPALITRLSMLLGASRVWLTGSNRVGSRDVARLFTRSLPAALYRVRWWGLVCALLVIGAAWATGAYLLHDPDAMNLVGDAATRRQFADEQFASYYQQYDNTSFAAQVWTNNAWLSTQMIVTGITLVLPMVLVVNTVLQLGVGGAIMAEHGALDIFFQLISPHGLLELSAVFVAMGTGVRMFWVLLVPGGRPRAAALAEAFRTALLVALGLTLALLLSGLIEGFVTPSDLPWALKVVIGVVACASFWAYVFVGGRAAVRQDFTGDDDEAHTAEKVPYAA